MVEIIVFILGVSIGSFLNVCIYRIPGGRSIVSPPSSCESCGKRILRRDLIPVISGLILRGSCRFCKAQFSMRHVYVELLTGIVFVALFIKMGYVADLFLAWAFTSYMIVLAFIDLDHHKILNTTVIFGAIFFAVLVVILETALKPLECQDLGLWSRFLAASISCFLGAAISLFGKKFTIFGMGDAKLLFIFGLVFGPKIIYIITAAIVLAAAFAIVGLLLKKVNLKQNIPLAPFFGIASFGFFLVICS